MDVVGRAQRVAAIVLNNSPSSHFGVRVLQLEFAGGQMWRLLVASRNPGSRRVRSCRRTALFWAEVNHEERKVGPQKVPALLYWIAAYNTPLGDRTGAWEGSMQFATAGGGDDIEPRLLGRDIPSCRAVHGSPPRRGRTCWPPNQTRGGDGRSGTRDFKDRWSEGLNTTSSRRGQSVRRDEGAGTRPSAPAVPNECGHVNGGKGQLKNV
jgi:hypothetical protein